jgi:hypothetical protein
MMRYTVPLIALTLAACEKKSPPVPAMQRATSQPDPSPSATDAIRGKVTEKIDAAQYSYLKLQTSSGEVWTAVPKTDKAVGNEVVVINAAWMQDFQSVSLKRTWQRIAFGTLEESTGAQLPPGHPPMGASGADILAAQSTGQGGLHRHPQAALAADLGNIKVAKAGGSSGRTIADVWTRKTQLNGQQVAVRGKVVKATNGVLGKNWLHLRDGSGEGDSADLTVASTDTAAVGDTVLIKGTVHLDRDLGAGYRYAVIVEDARVEAE